MELLKKPKGMAEIPSVLMIDTIRQNKTFFGVFPPKKVSAYRIVSAYQAQKKWRSDMGWLTLPIVGLILQMITAALQVTLALILLHVVKTVLRKDR
jgi:hypothetical protein